MKEKTIMESIGLRRTPQRRAILEYLSSVDNHPTAKTIYNVLKKYIPNLSLATVYQNLNILIKNNSLKEIKIKKMPSRYDFNTENHYHIVCESCGEIKDFNYPVFHEIENVASQLFNYEVYSHSLEVYGICKGCQKAMFSENL